MVEDNNISSTTKSYRHEAIKRWKAKRLHKIFQRRYPPQANTNPIITGSTASFKYVNFNNVYTLKQNLSSNAINESDLILLL